jgi:hypothetical protein
MRLNQDTTTISRAEQALEILESDAFKSAVQEARDSLFREWMRSDPKDSDARERIYFELKAIERVIGQLVGHVTAAKMERTKAEQKAANYGMA